MNKPIIGISTRIVSPTNYNEKRDAISHDLISILDKLDLNPILIPNNLLDTKKFLDQLTFSGFIISGGDNIGEFPQRDKTEKIILEYSSKKNLPILGICRGMQMINKFFGGKTELNKLKNHVNTNHSLKIINDKFKIIFKKDSINVNSYHNNLIQLKDLGQDLIPFAVYDDNSIEGYFHKYLSIYGVMWHPERTPTENSISLIKEIFITHID
jgi:gamma-glutamyl-gamma-aminobutyrate hydrolase PuuD